MCQALIIARNNPTSFGDIKESTSSIFFMATPHRGSDHAAILGTIAKIINLPFVGLLINRVTGEMRDDLISDLKKDDPNLKQITLDFSVFADGSLNFFSFLETKKTKPLSNLVSGSIPLILKVDLTRSTDCAGKNRCNGHSFREPYKIGRRP